MKAKLQRMTVTQLRAECGKRGLPKYQRHGDRLRKADLVESIMRHDRRGKSPEYVTPIVDDRRIVEERILSAVSRLTLNGGWVDEPYARAMYRVMAGFDNQYDRAILDGRRLDAIRSIRDEHEVGSAAWLDWNNRHDMAVRLSLGGMS